MPNLYFAFELNCEELVNPPVTALIKVTESDLAYLRSRHTAYLMMKQEDPSLLGMCYSNNIVSCYVEDDEGLGPLHTALTAAEGTMAINEVTYKMSRRKANELNMEGELLSIEENGIVFEAWVKHSTVKVTCPLLPWKELFKDPLVTT